MKLQPELDTLDGVDTQNNTRWSRRDFIGALAAISAFGTRGTFVQANQMDSQAAAPPQKKVSGDTFIGIQMGPHSLFDEGFDRCLDFIQETAAINAVMIYSQTYHMEMRRPLETLAPDHPVPAREMRGRKLPLVWMKPNDKYYSQTALRHQKIDSTFEFANRDLFAEVLEPLRKRKMKLYARILEASGPIAMDGIQNFREVLAEDAYGQPMEIPCWNNPDYREWWIACARDMFHSYELDGLQWGAERHGPLMTTILTGRPPFCFCKYCRERCQKAGIDAERARDGFKLLHAYVRVLQGSDSTPAGVFTGALRVLLLYPEVLSWEYQYRLSREEMAQTIYSTVKQIRPQAPVGWHVDHQQSSWDQVYRAELRYGEMAAYSDFIKPIVYHDILGPRIRWWYLDRLQKSVLKEIPLDESLDFYYETFGYDKTKEPPVDQLDKSGFSPDYVFRETRRTVLETAGKAKVYPGIGFDVPWNGRHYPSDPQRVYLATLKGFGAGADGIVVSREYDEMRAANLRAVGKAVRELSAQNRARVEISG